MSPGVAVFESGNERAKKIVARATIGGRLSVGGREKLVNIGVRSLTTHCNVARATFLNEVVGWACGGLSHEFASL